MGDMTTQDNPPVEVTPTAWLYTLHMELGQSMTNLRTERHPYPFGYPGENFSNEFTVTETPLYAASQRPAVADEDIEAWWDRIRNYPDGWTPREHTIAVLREFKAAIAAMQPQAPATGDVGELVEQVAAALKPFVDCCEWISDDESDEEWAKFRLLIGDYRRAKEAAAKLTELQALIQRSDSAR